MQYTHKDAHEHIICRILAHTAISIKVVPEESGKVEYECERLLGIAKFLAIPISLSRSYSTFPLCSGTTLIEIAVYKRAHERTKSLAWRQTE